MARVTHVVNGVRRSDTTAKLLVDDRRARVEADRRAGFDRRQPNLGRPESDRRVGVERRLGPRRLRDRGADEAVDLVAAARRARENADAAFSHFKVGAALEAADGFGHHRLQHRERHLRADDLRRTRGDVQSAFRRASRVHENRDCRGHRIADAAVRACRQILWEFGGNLEIHLANLKESKGVHQLKDLLPLPSTPGFSEPCTTGC